jgi:hypothetical protein
LLVFRAGDDRFSVHPVDDQVLLLGDHRGFAFDDVQYDIFAQRVEFLTIFFYLANFLEKELRFVFVSYHFHHISPCHNA